MTPFSVYAAGATWHPLAELRPPYPIHRSHLTREDPPIDTVESAPANLDASMKPGPIHVPRP